MHHAHWPDSTEKPLQEHPRSCRASGARPAGPLTQPHGKLWQPGGKDVLSVGSSIRGSLAGTPADARGLMSGQPWGSPKTTRGIPLKTCKKPKQSTSHLSTHPRHGPHRGGPRSPAEWPSQRLPRAGSASLEGLHLPRAGSASLEGSRLLRAGSASFKDLSPPRSRPSSRARLPQHARTDI
jgi:hypothetical protein